MQPLLPTEDCQFFYIKCQSSNTYISRGKYHNVNTYTTLGGKQDKSALKFIRFRVGDTSQPDNFHGRYVLVDEDGNCFSFNPLPSTGYSFALRLPWSGATYQTFDMGAVDGKTYNNIKISQQGLVASRFMGGSLQNQINLMAISDSSQSEFVLEPIEHTRFAIPDPNYPNDIPTPKAPISSTDIVVVSQAVLPRFLIANSQLTENNVINNPYYIMQTGYFWKLLEAHTNNTNTNLNITFSQTYGVSQEISETVEQSTSINVGISAGGEIKFIDLSVTVDITNSWGWSKTMTNSWQTEKSSSASQEIPPKNSLYIYQKYSVLQMYPQHNPQSRQIIATIPVQEFNYGELPVTGQTS